MSKRRRCGAQMIDTIEFTQFTGDVDISGPLELPSRLTSDTPFVITRTEGETTESNLVWIGARGVTGGGLFKCTRINNQVVFVFQPSTLMSTPTATTSTTAWVCQTSVPAPFIPIHTIKWPIIVTDNSVQVIGYFQITATTGVIEIFPVSGAFANGNNAIINEVQGTYYVN